MLVTGRQILDVALIANECVDCCLKSNLPTVICKLDIEKAYNHVSWGFPLKWRKWVYFCISTVHFLVLVNGEATRFFPSTRGLWQSHPLSPLLFVLVMETLSRLIIKANEVGFLEGNYINGSQLDEVLVSHLLLTDDILIFCKPEAN